MVSFFNKIFSIKVCVFNNADSSVVEAFANSFNIVPTNSCKELLKSYNLLLKSTDNGIIVIQELVGETSGTARPRRDITSLTQFSFAIQLRKHELVNNIKPYVEKIGMEINPVVLDPFFGKNRTLFFDNLNASNEINITKVRSDCQKVVMLDTDNKPIRDSAGRFQFEAIDIVPLTFRNSSGNYGVDEEDLASTIPNFFVSLPEASIFAVSAVHPQNNSVIIPNPPDERSELPYYQLDNGAYKLNKTIAGTTTDEIIYANDQLINTNQFGIIDIFREDATPFDYEIKFEIIL